MPARKEKEQPSVESISEKSLPAVAKSDTTTTTANQSTPPVQSAEPTEQNATAEQDPLVQIIQGLQAGQMDLANQLTELKQELAASHAVQRPSSPGILGLIESIAGPAIEIIKKIPTGGEGDGGLAKLFLDRMLARDALIDKVLQNIIAEKLSAPGAAPAPVQHVVVRG